jgi:hypothetical protein
MLLSDREEELTAMGLESPFNGAWNTDYGTLTLVQEGENVADEYSHDGKSIKGTVIGNVPKGTWSEAPTNQPRMMPVK